MLRVKDIDRDIDRGLNNEIHIFMREKQIKNQKKQDILPVFVSKQNQNKTFDCLF